VGSSFIKVVYGVGTAVPPQFWDAARGSVQRSGPRMASRIDVVSAIWKPLRSLCSISSRLDPDTAIWVARRRAPAGGPFAFGSKSGSGAGAEARAAVEGGGAP